MQQPKVGLQSLLTAITERGSDRIASQRRRSPTLGTLAEKRAKSWAPTQELRALLSPAQDCTTAAQNGLVRAQGKTIGARI